MNTEPTSKVSQTGKGLRKWRLEPNMGTVQRAGKRQTYSHKGWQTEGRSDRQISNTNMDFVK